MIRLAVDHPVVVWMLFAALMICGVYALPRLNLEAMPETELPSLTIRTSWLGASPTAVQQSITIPIEEAARGVYGIERIKAHSYPGNSQVEVSFRRGTNLEFARLQLSEQLGAVRRWLPATASQPVLVPFVPEEFRTDDFFTVSLISPLSPDQLRDEAQDWLVPRLLAIPGVADAELQGGAGSLIRIYIDLTRLEHYGLAVDRVYSRLAEMDDIVPGGPVRRAGRELMVSVRDDVSVDELEQTILAVVGGQPIRVQHVGRVERGYEDPGYFVRINGENVIQATIAKRSGQNAVGVSRRLRAELPGIAGAMPFPLSFEIDEDQGQELEDKLVELIYRSLIILALLFVVLVIALRQILFTGIVTASILLAVVISLSFFYFLGMSVNFITISGLTVCFGMLLDNSILTLDAIHRRLTGRPTPLARTALVQGAQEVTFPIFSTTLTTVVAFLSFSMLSGRLSLYYRPLAASVGIAMLASILVAFLWIPVALRAPASRIVARISDQPAAEQEDGARGMRRWLLVSAALGAVGLGIFAVLKGFASLAAHWPWVVGLLGLVLLVGLFVSFIEKITAFNLRHAWYPLVLFAALIAGAGYIFKHEIHQGGFWNQQDPEELMVYIQRPVGTDVVLSNETIKLFEAELLPLPEGIHAKSWSWENRGYMRVRFSPERLRSVYPELFRNRMILLAEELGGMQIYIAGFGDPYFKGGIGGLLSNSLIKVSGYNSKALGEICDGVMKRLERNRRVRNVRLTSGEQFERGAADETVIRIDRERLEAYHVSVAEVAGHLQRMLGIDTPWHMVIDGEDRRLQLSLEDAAAIQYDQVMRKTITTSRGPVRLGDLIDIETRPVVGSIHREDQRYSTQINWEYIGTDRMRQAFIQEVLAGLELPYGFKAEDVSGEQMTEEEEEEVETVLWVTLLFVFMTLAALFESLSLPFLVLVSVPMALIGVVGLFWITDASFDSSAKIGLVLLFGVVVNNAILLINRFRLQVREAVVARPELQSRLPQKRRLGPSDLWSLPGGTRRILLLDGIVSGMRIQLRSVLLTTGTTIAGLLPLLIQLSERNEGKDIWENLAL
ncbi:MAG: efflux RND transporter permease subunit, partial [Candidatus Eisenbacteria bacterium]